MTSPQESAVSNILRSCRSNQIAFVKFYNASKYEISIEWIDFHGHHKAYHAKCKPGELFPVKTYVGHPWLAYESKYRYLMKFSPGNLSVYFPKGSQMINGMPTQDVVTVLTPLSNLEKLCLQTVHKNLTDIKDINQLNVPKIIKQKLKELFDSQYNPNTPIRMINKD